MEQIFFTSWTSILRTIIIAVAAYAGLILMLRGSGKRTLSKMNAFDFIVTVALGSTLATVLLTKSVALADGLLAFALLIGLQYLLTWLSVRYKAVDELIKGQPALLVYQGQLLHTAMKAERVTEGEIMASLREHGLSNLMQVEAVVLETEGSLSVIKKSSDEPVEVLGDVSAPSIS
ncbi:DUF421 domain-containing protein [Hymenobacter taeanensis]|uniref:DUF421 domain-containing protein n=1 Tax=Hymenobacter taeanensis TaxID=2735321 RepID=A0A6M6BE39_9BACT|nr:MULTISPECIES: YetF domain-containing protein [Hymenobacter]QJX46250.1 DUF421 domain-containing protein [Hymenobacter taeanensis]UOQ80104.1 DUF421 domain-containing protein [Hymenobacter sp. 5414T-23]